MPTLEDNRTVHEIEIDAPADVVYRIIADAEGWPRRFAPAVHVERTPLGADTERLWIWATGAGVVRAWSSIRTLDEERRFVSFQREVSAPPVKSMGGTWTATPVANGRTRLLLTHEFQALDDDPEQTAWIAESTDQNSSAELADIKRLAEDRSERADLEFSFEDSMVVHGEAGDVYEFLYDAAKWPQRLPHVAELRLVEEEGSGMQQMSMWTRASDGTTHLTESVRICFPANRLVYKQTVTPALIAAHTGEWVIEPADGGVLVRSRHAIVLNGQALGAYPPAGTTWGSTRDFVRASIGGNSLATLRSAKEFVEAL